MAMNRTGLAVGIALLWAGLAWASEPGVITARGTAYVDKLPEKMRLALDIRAAGSDVDQAIALLRQKRESVVAKLKELGAAEQAIRFDGPHPPAEDKPLLSPSVRVVNGRVVMSALQDEEEEASPRVELVLGMTADWELKAKDAEGVVREFEQLKAKVREADLAGLALKASAPADEEEEEDEQPPKPSPTWRFVCRLSETEQAQLVERAYAQAQARALRLAAAAGLGVGLPAGMESRDLSPSDGNPVSASSLASSLRVLQAAGGSGGEAESPDETVGNEPHRIRCGVQVTVGFQAIGR